MDTSLKPGTWQLLLAGPVSTLEVERFNRKAEQRCMVTVETGSHFAEETYEEVGGIFSSPLDPRIGNTPIADEAIS